MELAGTAELPSSSSLRGQPIGAQATPGQADR